MRADYEWKQSQTSEHTRRIVDTGEHGEPLDAMHLAACMTGTMRVAARWINPISIFEADIVCMDLKK